MATLGRPQGIFDLSDSDKCVGSYLKKADIKEILGIDDNELNEINFKIIENNEVADEIEIHKLWYKTKGKSEKASLDELILIPIIRRAFSNIIIERQIKIGRFSMDLKLTLPNKSPVFIEFDGPSHFAITQWGPPKHEPFRKKKTIEDATGIEVVNWPYWIQRCTSNVKALFDNSIKGYGVLWSTEYHFGKFVFENSAQIIEIITKRFNAVDENGYGYFYGGQTMERNNPEHPIIKQILNHKAEIEIILPKGYKDKNYWLPNELKH